MKLLAKTFLLFSLCMLLCGCPSPQPPIAGAIKQFRDNHYDFGDVKRTYFKGIYLDIPQSFTNSYSNFTYKPFAESLSKHNIELGIFLSVEKFDKSDAREFLFGYEDQTPALVAVHDFYMQQRRNSLVYLENSIKTELPKGSKYKGSLEVVFGRAQEYQNDLQYMIATIEKGDSWYVMQMISSRELSAYLLDDFKNIIQSVR